MWDIRSYNVIQAISAEGGHFYVSSMCCISRHDKFVIGGKRLVFYNNSIVAEGGKGNFNDDIYPIDADFNEYFNFIVVLTK